MSDSDGADNPTVTMRAIARALAIAAEQEQLNLSESTVADLRSAARGEIDMREVTRRIYARLQVQPPGSVP